MQLKRCYVYFFNANAEILKNLNISKARGAGEVKACYSAFSFNAATCFAEGVVEFDEQVWINKLEEHLAMQGAACITILTFAHNDNNQSAGAALARVWKSAKAPGFELITQGECNAKLLAKAEEITQEDESAESGTALDEKMQAAFKQSLLEMKETSQKSLVLQEEINEKMATVATKEDLVVVATKSDLAEVATKEDIAKSQGELTTMRKRAEHAEKFSFVVRGQLGGEESKKAKSLRRELEASHNENEKLKRQMTERDLMDAERNNRLEAMYLMEAERNNRMDARLGRMEACLGLVNERDSRREYHDKRLEEIIGRMEEALDQLSSPDI